MSIGIIIVQKVRDSHDVTRIPEGVVERCERGTVGWVRDFRDEERSGVGY